MRYFMFNKPKGCVTARTDSLHKTVMDFFPDEEREGLHPVGRLDKDTEGLLLITDDGAFTYRLMHPESHVPKKYFFYAAGTLTEEKAEIIRQGVTPAGFDSPAQPAEIVCTRTGKITAIKEYLPEDKREKLLKCPWQPIFSGYITITEGKKHQVKRMLRAIDCCVLYLVRVEIGGVSLDGTLEPGQYRPLTGIEKKKLGIE